MLADACFMSVCPSVCMCSVCLYGLIYLWVFALCFTCVFCIVCVLWLYVFTCVSVRRFTCLHICLYVGLRVCMSVCGAWLCTPCQGSTNVYSQKIQLGGVWLTSRCATEKTVPTGAQPALSLQYFLFLVFKAPAFHQI